MSRNLISLKLVLMLKRISKLLVCDGALGTAKRDSRHQHRSERVFQTLSDRYLRNK